jgi:hypothetical protein
MAMGVAPPWWWVGRDKPFDDYGVVGMAHLADLGVQIGKAVHHASQQLSNGRLTVARVAVELVTWMVEGSDCRLNVVPVFRVGVLIDDCLAALAKAGWPYRHRNPLAEQRTHATQIIGMHAGHESCWETGE